MPLPNFDKGGGTELPTVLTYADLPASAGAEELYVVINSTGSRLLFNRKLSGLYNFSTGSWVRLSANDTVAYDSHRLGGVLATEVVSEARARVNHTGTQLAVTISDLDEEIDNNLTVVIAHDHVTSSGEDHTYIDQDVTIGSSPNFANITSLEDDIRTTQSTGWKFGGEISIGVGGAGVATTIEISAGEYQIVDTSVSPPTVTEVVFAGATVTPSFIGLATGFYAVDVNGAVQQKASLWDENELRTFAAVGVSGHIFGVVILTITQNSVCYDVGAQLSDLRVALGAFNIDGNQYLANGANKSLNKTSGRMFQQGGGYTSLSGESIDIIPQDEVVVIPVFMTNQSGVGTGPTNFVDTDNYDLGGVTTSIPNNKFVIHRINMASDTTTIIQRGSAIHASQAAAIAAIQSEEHTTNPNLQGTILRYFLVIKEGVSDLSNTSEAIFVEAVSGQAAGSGGISVTSLQGAYNNSSEPEITTSGTLGAVSFREGQSNDAFDVLEVMNGAAAQTFAVKGNGNIITTGTVDGRDVSVDGTAQDSHISDTTIHYPQSSISIPASQVSNFDAEVANNAAVAANTAKVSNVAHPLVESAVPVGALFTDTVYDDTAIQAEVDLNTAKVSNVVHPLVETAVPVGAVFTDTPYNDTDIQAEVTLNTTDRHTHVNKIVLDKFGEDVGGDPTYNGIAIDTTIAQRDVYDGLDSLDNTISLSAKQGKVLKDVQDTQQTAINLNTAKVSNVAHPLVETAVPVGALFTDTDTVYDDTAIQAEVTLNTNARHTHSNKANLDVIDQDLATTNDVTFNKVTTDATTGEVASFGDTDFAAKFINVRSGNAGGKFGMDSGGRVGIQTGSAKPFHVRVNSNVSGIDLSNGDLEISTSGNAKFRGDLEVLGDITTDGMSGTKSSDDYRIILGGVQIIGFRRTSVGDGNQAFTYPWAFKAGTTPNITFGFSVESLNQEEGKGGMIDPTETSNTQVTLNRDNNISDSDDSEFNFIVMGAAP